jgi:aspartate racemase
MTKGRCLGLIGGLGVGATVHYYRRLAEAHAERAASLDFVMVHAETARVFEYVAAGDGVGLAEYLLGFVQRMKEAGAEFAAIPAVTPHYCMRELLAKSPLPILNIFDPLAEDLAARKLRRVGVFGTQFVMDSELFGMVNGVEIVHARPDEAESIHKTYVELAHRGKGTEEQFRSLTKIAKTLCERDGAEAIVLAGTDLALLFDETNTEFPSVDCAALHLKAIADVLLAET